MQPCYTALTLAITGGDHLKVITTYTWHHKHPIKMSRLDFVLVSEDIMSVISNSSILPKYKSDHSPVIVEILISKHARGNGYWKFNNSLLKEVEFVKMIKDTILDIKSQYAAAPHDGDNVKNCHKLQ
jgi:hypothetical protein